MAPAEARRGLTQLERLFALPQDCEGSPRHDHSAGVSGAGVTAKGSGVTMKRLTSNGRMPKRSKGSASVVKRQARGGGRQQRTPRLTCTTAAGPCEKATKQASDKPRRSASGGIRGAFDKESEESLVGAVGESAEEHRRRHVRLEPSCARCQWLRWGSAWRCKQGCHSDCVWVAERQVEDGGAWGLGCLLCRRALAALDSGSQRTRVLRSRIGSRWARFEVRSCFLQASSLSNHAQANGHKLAQTLRHVPEKHVSEVCAQSSSLSAEDMELLQGSVPQPADWLRAWRYLRQGVSFLGAQGLLRTEQFIGQGQAMISCSKQGVQALQEILVECIRMEKREWLRQASAVSLCVDDRGAYTILRFRCDSGCSFRGGVLGVTERVASGTLLEQFDEDACMRYAAVFRELVERFCTPLHGDVDGELLGHIRQSTRSFVSDGAPSVLKTGRLLKNNGFPNIAFFIRDPAHAVRIAARDPLHADEKFGAFWTEVFDARHALIPDIQNSEVWRARFQACQKRVKDVLGHQGAGLATILRHFSLAKHRFESFTSPARKYCLLLSSIALLLATIAGDERKERATRMRCEQLLESMTPESIVVAGLTADYGSECMAFIRFFDKANRDPAVILRKRDEFIARMRVLFLEGFAAMEVPEEPAARANMTMLQACMAQVLDKPVFHYNNKRHVLWSQGASANVAGIMGRMHKIVLTMIERLQAELHDEDVCTAFHVFDIRQWEKQEGRTMRRAFVALCNALGVDSKLGRQELAKMLPAAIAIHSEECTKRKADGLSAEVDNRDVWGALLRQPTMQDCHVLPDIIRLYMAVELGTCSVERTAGLMKSRLDSHSGPLGGPTLWMLVEGAADGPSQEEDLFTLSPMGGGTLQFTDFSRNCQRLWLLFHGRRFGSCAKRRARATKEPKLDTEAAIEKRRRLAADDLVHRAAQGSDGQELCVGGMRRSQLTLAAASRKPPVPLTKRMGNFLTRTRQILANRRAESRARRAGTLWCPAPRLRKATRQHRTMEDLHGGVTPMITVVALMMAPDFAIPRTRAVTPLPSLFSNAAAADVLVIPDLLLLDTCLDLNCAIVLIYAVGLGKTVVAGWHGRRPDQGPHALRFTRRSEDIESSNILVLSQHMQGHHNVCRALRSCEGEKSYWVVRTRPVGTREQVPVTTLDSLQDLRTFLLKERRFTRKPHSHDTFAAERCR